MPKLATGLLIDPSAKSVGPIQVDPTMLSELYMVLGCKAVEYVSLDSENFIYVDEEGLLREKPEPFFQIRGHAPMAGRGIVFGIDANGEAASTTIWIGDMWEMVTFPDIEFVGMQQEPGVEYDPIFGEVAHISITPIFREKKK